MATVYDNELSPANIEKFVFLATRGMHMLSVAVSPSITAVNAFPILRYLPPWFPGAEFKRFANECRGYVKQMREIPFNFVKEKIVCARFFRFQAGFNFSIGLGFGRGDLRRHSQVARKEHCTRWF